MIRFIGSLFAMLVTVSALFSSSQALGYGCYLVYSNETLVDPVYFTVRDGIGPFHNYRIASGKANYGYLEVKDPCEISWVCVHFDKSLEPGYQSSNCVRHDMRETLTFVYLYKGGFTPNGDPIGIWLKRE